MSNTFQTIGQDITFGSEPYPWKAPHLQLDDFECRDTVRDTISRMSDTMLGLVIIDTHKLFTVDQDPTVVERLSDLLDVARLEHRWRVIRPLSSYGPFPPAAVARARSGIDSRRGL